MTKVRQDAWSHEDDLLLAETVLRHIREGSTQLNAFEEVGDRLDRTGAACGFRWNAIVRKKYEQAVSIAKRQRKHMKRRAVEKPDLEKKRVIKKPAALSVIEPVSQFSPPQEEIMEETASRDALTLDSVIRFLQQLNQQNTLHQASLQENEQLKRELDHLREENASLKRDKEALTMKQQTMEEDYQSIIQIMERARKMVMFQENEATQATTSPSFKMDKNGNLEKMA